MTTQSLSKLETYLAEHHPTVKQLIEVNHDEIIGWHRKKNSFTSIFLEFCFGPVKVMSQSDGDLFFNTLVDLLDELPTIMDAARHDMLRSVEIKQEDHALISSNTLPELIYLAPGARYPATISVKGEYWSRRALEFSESGCIYCERVNGKMSYEGWEYST